MFLTISSAPLRKLAIGHLYEAKNQGAFRWRNWVLSVVQCNPSCGLQVALIVIVIVIVRRVRNLQPATHIGFPCACERVCVFLIIRRTRTCPLSPSTISLCLSTFPGAKFRRKKSGVKAHVLYDIDAQVPAFYTVTTASKHDSTAMSSIL